MRNVCLMQQYCRDKYEIVLWEIQNDSWPQIHVVNWQKSNGQTGGARVDKRGAQLDLLQLEPKVTCPSFDSVQALSTCCRIQLCMTCGGVQATFSVLEASEVKFSALEVFVLPTDIHDSRGTRLGSAALPPSCLAALLAQPVYCRLQAAAAAAPKVSCAARSRRIPIRGPGEIGKSLCWQEREPRGRIRAPPRASISWGEKVWGGREVSTAGSFDTQEEFGSCGC